ncbi:nickel-dependent hydrogenase large subunit [Thiohalorhabdus sp. Cl-TMA]|uniref:Nickel-dependent hydrogenase large subunit n=1 Tax=Thiohalorhabdus methylotrophus TaxID=3242694 RepID=A0ABV4TW78_9GAMM
MTASPGIEGRLTVRVTVAAGRIRAVSVRSSRPVHAGKLFRGRMAEGVPAMVPLVYAVCGTAQTVAALGALEGARGILPGAAHQSARRITVLAETAREHLTAILTDWARCLDREPRAAGREEIHKWPKRARDLLYPEGGFETLGGGPLTPERGGLAALRSEMARVLEERVLGMPPEAFLDLPEIGAAEAPSRWRSGPLGPAMLAWLRRTGRAGSGSAPLDPLPDFGEAEVAGRMAAGGDAFLARPEWDGAPRETSPLTRNRDHHLVASAIHHWGAGVLARHTARLVELAGIPGRMEALAAGLEPDRAARTTGTASGAGVGVVEAARGRLVHRATLEGESVRDYQVLAPTEWNFHPEGALARGMRGRPVPGEDEAAEVDLLARALDPCIGYGVEVYHA